MRARSSATGLAPILTMTVRYPAWRLSLTRAQSSSKVPLPRGQSTGIASRSRPPQEGFERRAQRLRGKIVERHVDRSQSGRAPHHQAIETRETSLNVAPIAADEGRSQSIAQLFDHVGGRFLGERWQRIGLAPSRPGHRRSRRAGRPPDYGSRCRRPWTGDRAPERAARGERYRGDRSACR